MGMLLLFFFLSVFGRETNNGLCFDVYKIHTLWLFNAQKRSKEGEESTNFREQSCWPNAFTDILNSSKSK